MPGKQVSQATFDAIVREAIDDFGMPEREALADAMEQLKLAGVTDFSGLVTSVPASAAAEHAGVVFAAALADAGSDAELVNAAVRGFRAALSAADDADHENELIGVAGAHGAVEHLCAFVQAAVAAAPASAPACDALARLCAAHEINRLRALREGCAVPALQKLLRALLPALGGPDEPPPRTAPFAAAASALAALRAVQRRSEKAKQAAAAAGGMDLLLAVADRSVEALCARGRASDSTGDEAGDEAGDETGDKAGDTRARALAARGALGALRQLLSGDDATVAVSETFNRARVLAGEPSAAASGLRALSGGRTLPEVALRALRACEDGGGGADSARLVAEAVGAVRLCAVSDEICRMLVGLGFAGVAGALLRERAGELPVVRAAVALLRNLAARDECKTDIAALAGPVRAAVNAAVPPDRALVEHLAGFVAGLTLRRPDIARRFADDGVVDDVVRGMQAFPGEYSVLKAGCLAVRNAASRDEAARTRVRAVPGVEAAVRHAQKTFPGECDTVAYSALWELGVLADDEIRRDERYKMPDGMFSNKVVR